MGPTGGAAEARESSKISQQDVQRLWYCCSWLGWEGKAPTYRKTSLVLGEQMGRSVPSWSSWPESSFYRQGKSRASEMMRGDKHPVRYKIAISSSRSEMDGDLCVCHRLSSEPACLSADSWHLNWWSLGRWGDPEVELEWFRSPFSWNEHKVCSKFPSASSCCFSCLCLSSCSEALLCITFKRNKMTLIYAVIWWEIMYSI